MCWFRKAAALDKGAQTRVHPEACALRLLHAGCVEQRHFPGGRCIVLEGTVYLVASCTSSNPVRNNFTCDHSFS